MAKGLTEKQRKVLEYIIDYQKTNGYPPTIRETGDAFGIGSLRGVTVHLDALVRKGFVTRDRTSRSLRVIGADPRSTLPVHSIDSALAPPPSARIEATLFLPLLRGGLSADFAAAGGKLEVGNVLVERYVSVPEELASMATPNGFVIRVGASGVYQEPVLPGDLLVIRPQRSVLRGELAIYVVDGDLSIQRHSETLSHREESAIFIPAPPEVVGRVVGLLRRY